MKPRSRSTNPQAGMTLVEIMIVVAILGLMASIVGVAVFKNFQEARRQTAQTQIKDFGSALQLYNRDCGKYPTTAQGLQALVANPGNCPRWKGYLENNTIPLDPWGNPYDYFYPGVHGQPEFEIISRGPDSEPNTQDDVVSWSTEPGGAAAGAGGAGQTGGK